MEVKTKEDLINLLEILDKNDITDLDWIKISFTVKISKKKEIKSSQKWYLEPLPARVRALCSYFHYIMKNIKNQGQKPEKITVTFKGAEAVSNFIKLIEELERRENPRK